MPVVTSMTSMGGPPRRHHYIPRFLMRGFSLTPDAHNPPIWRLDKKTGKPSRSAVNSDAVVKDFYKLEDCKKLAEELAKRESSMCYL